ncbi:ATP-grasp domain-containing protein [Kitasatospora sp. NPDC058965]|uniref:ATP-grasp domain-containing protein n=1 Tax=Kitasatospora sp. NPDC058965 TaxID=3346682 RepID=UPI0036A78E99
MTPHRPAAGPVLIVGFVGLTVPAIGRFQGPGSVVYVEEPDVLRKRHVHQLVEDVPFVREVIGWEYQLPGRADEFYHAHPGLDPVAVIPAIEYATPFAARLAERYGLPGAGLGAALLLRDKSLLRLVTAAAGIPNPASARVHGPDEVREFMARHTGPVVLKPTNRQASVGVRVIRHPDEVEAAWAGCLVQDEGVFVPDRPMELAMLAEQFVAGEEFSVELLVRDGSTLFANVTGKQLYPGPFPVERSHAVPADLPPAAAAELVAATERVVLATGFATGVLHCEWIVADGVPHLVECAGRMPGDAIPDLIEVAYPVELFRDYFAVMCDEDPPPLPRTAAGGAAVRFLAAEGGAAGQVESITGIEAAQAAEGVLQAVCGVAKGHRFGGLRNSWDRAGIVMTRAGTAAEALRLAEAAAALVRIEVGAQAPDTTATEEES